MLTQFIDQGVRCCDSEEKIENPGPLLQRCLFTINLRSPTFLGNHAYDFTGSRYYRQKMLQVKMKIYLVGISYGTVSELRWLSASTSPAPSAGCGA
jgi:hypothetical protein